jgi:hypothetical protein
MKRQDFENIIDANPTLTAHGFGLDGHPGESFQAERTRLLNSYTEALACEEFFSKCRRTKDPHTRLGSSYRIKHMVERFIRDQKGHAIYIPEGVAIVAAIHQEFRMKPKEGTTSVFLNISRKTKIDGKSIIGY